MRVTVFGVRGSCPSAGGKHRRAGGKTSCVLVSVDEEPPLPDLGTGLRGLGEALGGTGLLLHGAQHPVEELESKQSPRREEARR